MLNVCQKTRSGLAASRHATKWETWLLEVTRERRPERHEIAMANARTLKTIVVAMDCAVALSG